MEQDLSITTSCRSSMLLTKLEMNKVTLPYVRGDTYYWGAANEVLCQAQHEQTLRLATPLIRAETAQEIFDWIESTSNSGYIYEGTYTYDTECDNQLFVDLGDYQTYKASTLARYGGE